MKSKLGIFLSMTSPKIMPLLIILAILVFPSHHLEGQELKDDQPNHSDTTIHPKLSPRLNKLVFSYQEEGIEGVNRFISENKVRTQDELIETILVIVSDDPLKELPAETIFSFEKRIKQIGGKPGSHAFNYVQAWIPISALLEVADWEEVELVREPITLRQRENETEINRNTQSLLTTSEGLSVIGATSWQNAGYMGQGVKVGIIDLGFKDYQSLLGTELPANLVTWVSGTQADFLSDEHGTACAEIIYDIAPNAQLFFVNIVNADVDFANAVNWLETQGVDVISCSIGLNLTIYANLIYMALNNFGSAQAIANQLQYFENLKAQWDQIINNVVSQGIVWSQAAGNHANKKWKGFFNDSDRDSCLNFTSNVNKNEIYLATNFQYGEEVYVVLLWGWDNDLNSYDDYDLYIENEYGFTVGSSLIYQSLIPIGLEACKFTPFQGRRYFVKAKRYFASPQEIGILLGWDAISSSLAYYSPSETVLLSPPASNQSAITVGAVPWNNWRVIEPFSCQGPTDTGLVKPDFVAPDGVSTWSYAPYPFFGTSASAPHIAGASTLVLQAYPQYPPSQVKNFLESRAVDLGSTGKDNAYGSGLVSLGTPPQSSFTPCKSPTKFLLSRACGTIGQPVTITVTGESGFYYKYWVNENSYCDSVNSPRWVMLQDWTTSNTFIWTPSSSGLKTIVVWTATNINDPCAGIIGGSYLVGTGSQSCIHSTGITVSRNCSPSGTPISITINPSTPGLKYKYWANNNSYCTSPDNPNWQLLQDWTGSSTCTWTPINPGLYTIVVWTATDTVNPCTGIIGLSYEAQ